MITKEEKIAELKAKSPTLQEGINDTVRTLTNEEYEATIEAWADAWLAKEQAKIDAENARQLKISAYEKLGLTPEEIEALLPTPNPIQHQHNPPRLWPNYAKLEFNYASKQMMIILIAIGSLTAGLLTLGILLKGLLTIYQEMESLELQIQILTYQPTKKRLMRWLRKFVNALRKAISG